MIQLIYVIDRRILYIVIADGPRLSVVWGSSK